MIAAISPSRADAYLSGSQDRREARLRSEAGRLLRGRVTFIGGRELPETHFEFRGSGARGGERGTRSPG